MFKCRLHSLYPKNVLEQSWVLLLCQTEKLLESNESTDNSMLVADSSKDKSSTRHCQKEKETSCLEKYKFKVYRKNDIFQGTSCTLPTSTYLLILSMTQ